MRRRRVRTGQSIEIPPGARREAWSAVSVLGVALIASSVLACGKKGPPLPPLIKVPAAPADFTAERRGVDVNIQFTIPATNSDGTKPANIERVDVYRFTGPPSVTDDQLIRFGTSIASVQVKAPRNPDVTTEPGEPAEEPELEQEGLDQGTIAQIEDELNVEALTPANLPVPRSGVASRVERLRPLVTELGAVPSTTYVAVGISKGGRRGLLSRRVAVPLVPPPAPPSSPLIDYDEQAISVRWAPPAAVAAREQPAPAGLLPSHTVGVPPTTFSYHVYDLSPSASAGAKTAGPGVVGGQLRLTSSPVSELRYEDRRMDWGSTRCYTVRTVETIGGLSLESDAPPPTCATLADRFPPAAPKDLKAVATERAISLIWEPNTEPDLAGYIVLRGMWPGDKLERLTPEPGRETSFNDTVPSGVHYVYAVQAIDKTGNVSQMSNRADETAR